MHADPWNISNFFYIYIYIHTWNCFVLWSLVLNFWFQEISYVASGWSIGCSFFDLAEICVSDIHQWWMSDMLIPMSGYLAESDSYPTARWLYPTSSTGGCRIHMFLRTWNNKWQIKQKPKTRRKNKQEKKRNRIKQRLWLRCLKCVDAVVFALWLLGALSCSTHRSKLPLVSCEMMAAWEVDDNDSNDLLRAPEEVPAVSEFEAWLVKRWPLNSSEDSFDTPPETVSKCEAIPGSSETWSWSWRRWKRGWNHGFCSEKSAFFDRNVVISGINQPVE